MRRGLSLLIVLLSAATTMPSGAAHAQSEPGTLIRVTARVPEREYWIGPFVSFERDTITMRDAEKKGAIVAVPALQVLRVEMSSGRHGNGLQGAALGLLLGAVLGASLGHKSGGAFPLSENETATLDAIGIGLLGAGVGGMIGAQTVTERWRPIQLEDLGGIGKP